VFQTIVVGTDGSETAQRAVEQAVALAGSLGARLEIVSAYEPVSNQRLRQERQEVPPDMTWMVNAREDVEATLRGAMDVAEAAGVPATSYARQGDPADAILDVAEERRADLIVVEDDRGLPPRVVATLVAGTPVLEVRARAAS